MRKRYTALILALVLAAFSVFGSSFAMNSSPHKLILGYYPVYHASDQNAFRSLTTYASYLNQIATITFQINDKGDIIGKVPQDGIALAQSKQMAAYAAITNLLDSGFDSALAHKILNDSSLRKQTIQNITKLVQENHYNGVTIDFENMYASDRANFNSFIRELSTTLRPMGVQTAVCVMAKTADAPNSPWIGVFDYQTLGQAADYIHVMTYDQNGPWGDPGPIAGLPWVEQVLKYAISHIPAEKLMLGVPAYGYDWNVTTKQGQAVPWKSIPKLVQTTKAVPKWDEASQSPYLTYTEPDGSNHVVWYENNRSIQLKSELVIKYNLAGVFMWRLGLEDEEFWKVLSKGLAQTETLVVQLSPIASTYHLKDSVPITLHVVNSLNTPQKGVKTVITVTRPDGRTFKYSGVTDKSGNRKIRFYNGASYPLGTYRVSVNVSQSGFADQHSEFTYLLGK